MALAAQDGSAIDRGQDLDLGADGLDRRRTDEDGVQRAAAESGHVEVRLERVDLPAPTRRGAPRCRRRRSSAGRRARRGSRGRAGSFRRRCRTPASPPPAAPPPARTTPKTGAASTWWSTSAARQHQGVDVVEIRRQAAGDRLPTPGRDSTAVNAVLTPLAGPTRRPSPGGLAASHMTVRLYGAVPSDENRRPTGTLGNATGTRSTTGGSPCTPRPAAASGPAWR